MQFDNFFNLIIFKIHLRFSPKISDKHINHYFIAKHLNKKQKKNRYIILSITLNYKKYILAPNTRKRNAIKIK